MSAKTLWHHVQSQKLVLTSLIIICFSDFCEAELKVVDDAMCCATEENISSEISACLYYASGYVAFKEKVCISCTAAAGQPSEFLDLVSRGGLSHPSAQLYAFCRSLFFIFSSLSVEPNFSRCTHRMVRLFLCLGAVFPADFEGKLKVICKRFANIFFKGIVNSSHKGANTIQVCGSQRKLRKIS